MSRPRRRGRDVHGVLLLDKPQGASSNDVLQKVNRKVGHLNLTDSDTDRLSATLEAIKPLLPPEYTSGLFWAQSQLS